MAKLLWLVCLALFAVASAQPVFNGGGSTLGNLFSNLRDRVRSRLNPTTSSLTDGEAPAQELAGEPDLDNAKTGLRRTAAGVGSAANKIAGAGVDTASTAVNIGVEVVGAAKDMAVTGVKGAQQMGQLVGNVGENGLIATGLGAADIAATTAADIVKRGLACCLKHANDLLKAGANVATAGFGAAKDLLDAGVGLGQGLGLSWSR